MKTLNKDKNFSIQLNQEYLFAFIALLFGVLLSFLNPPCQSNDEDRHFYNAYMRSEGQLLPEKNGDMVGYMIPESILNVVNPYQGIDFASGNKIKRETVDNYAQVKLNKNNRTFYNHPNYSINPVPYLPYMIGINIGKIFNSNPMYLLWSARISGLIFYIIVIFFAIRIIPVYKNVMMFIALTPMALYQASSVTYDVMAISLAFLMISMFVRMALSNSQISTKDIIWLIVVALFQRYAKDGYILIPFLLILVPRNKFSKPLVYYGLLAYFVLLYFLPGWTWGAALSGADISGGRPFQTDYLFDSSQNLSYNLSNPFAMVGHIFMNILSQGDEWINGIIARFGYAYISPSKFVITIHAILLLTVALFDSKKDILIPNLVRYGTFMFGFLGIMMIIAGFLIMGSPVGSSQIFGLQGRYFLPVLPLLLFVIYNTKYNNESFQKYGSIGIAIYSIIVLSYISSFINSYYYSN